MAGAGVFSDLLDDRVQAILDSCTQCGKCVEACPMTGPADIDVAEAPAIVGGVLDLLRDGPGTAPARRWASVCSGSGACLDACGDGVNPRFMLTLARLAMQRSKGDDATRSAGKAGFQDMTRAVRVLSRLQLSPDQLRRLGQLPGGDPAPENPELVFYTGCNLLRTPHIALHCLDVLDALGVAYAVQGGPGSCCGILQLRGGDGDGASRQADSTIARFAGTGATQIVAWCPTCQIQMSEAMLPAHAATGKAPLDLTMFAVWLAQRLDRLTPLFVNRVERRVGLHEHPGVAGVSKAVVAILDAIPGLELVDLEQPRVGFMCNALRPMPDYARQLHESQLEAAAAAGVDTLAGVYHACHRELCSHQRDWPFEVVNFMELIGEAMGIRHADRYKQLKMMQDADAILADCAETIAARNLDADEVRAVIVDNLLGEQPLPLRGA
jgi:Fe-S oxidoreductase